MKQVHKAFHARDVILCILLPQEDPVVHALGQDEVSHPSDTVHIVEVHLRMAEHCDRLLFPTALSDAYITYTLNVTVGLVMLLARTHHISALFLPMHAAHALKTVRTLYLLMAKAHVMRIHLSQTFNGEQRGFLCLPCEMRILGTAAVWCGTPSLLRLRR